MSQESNKIASNTLVQIIGRVCVLILSLISIKLITTYLGPQGTGYYNTVVTYLSFVIVIADFGLFSVVVREVSKNKDNSKKIYANVFTLRFVSAILFTLLATGIAFLTSYPSQIKIGILLAALFPIFNLAASVYDMLFQYKLRMHNTVYSEVISKIIVVALIYLFSRMGFGYYSIVLTVSIASLLIFIIKAIISRDQLPLSFAFDKKFMIELMKMSLPLGIVFIVNNIYFKIDTLLLFYFKGAVDVGIYAVAYRVLETSLFAGSYLTSSLKPLLSISIESNKEKASKAVTTAISYLLFMALILALACVVFPRDIIMFLSNDQFLPGTKALIILGLVPIFIFVNGMFGEILIAKDLRKQMIKISTMILLVNIGLNLFLIPRYSFNGAALATLLSEIVLLVITFRIVNKALPIIFDKAKTLKLILFALIAGFIGEFFKSYNLYFLFNLLIVVIVFLALSYLFEAIPKGTLDNYLISLRKRWNRKNSQ